MAPRGTRNPASKLTEADVRYIREHYRPSIGGGRPGQRGGSLGPVGLLATKFGINRRTVRAIALGETWNWMD